MVQRPTFQKPPPTGATNSPEELFYALSAGRARSHAYLRGPQQDVLREYNQYRDAPDVAFELPTGSGKTTVGLLIAEWHRRKGKSRSAFLTLTNQLAGQVIGEANALGISVADLRGNKDRRSRAEEAKFLDGSALAISTYSNLFNVNPIIANCGVIVLDDAHGGGEFAASMWTLRVTAKIDPSLYGDLAATAWSLMTETQQSSLSDTAGPNHVEIVDLGLSSSARDQFLHVLDCGIKPQTSLWYAWSQVKLHFHACHIFFSKYAVVVRPYIIPTFGHPPFSNAEQRIYLSATLGDVEDLKRAYAVENIETIRAAQNQDGRRFVFVPELSMGEDQAWGALTAIWPRLEPQRAVLIAPSFPALDRADEQLQNGLHQFNYIRYEASHIEDSLDLFTGATNAVLELANRYDGLDLPDDDCRLLLLSESPRATNELEANLSSAWKLGPALRWREATRLVQGMGRCTRNATDFAVIILFGESLVNASTNGALLQLLPPTLQAEIMWGRTQLRELKLDQAGFAEMVSELIADKAYRRDAEQSIMDHAAQMPATVPPPSIGTAALEVAHAKAYWSGDFTRANELGRMIADKLSGKDWAGYRSWWLYLASLAARLSENPTAEMDALKRAKGTGVNAGWLDHVIRSRGTAITSPQEKMDDLSAIVLEGVWTSLDELGWSGKRFLDFTDRMQSGIADVKNHKAFHQGLVALGKLLGAQANAPGQQGDPDVIWRFGDSTWVCFEAKSEKLENGQGIAKKDLLQAKGHVEWVKFFESQGKRNVQIIAVIIAPIDKVQPSAEPHCEEVYFLGTQAIADWASRVRAALLELRAKFAGQDFAAARVEFVQDTMRLSLALQATLALIKSSRMTS
ncbi:MAG TPA: DEAD/DEAH box helicase [Rhodocyclaceae bacterium]|nr:DEAD/DEAH box helicase [Rhodocyclaceae bacterium]